MVSNEKQNIHRSLWCNPLKLIFLYECIKCYITWPHAYTKAHTQAHRAIYMHIYWQSDAAKAYLQLWIIHIFWRFNDVYTVADGVFLVSQGPKLCLHQDCSRMPNKTRRLEFWWVYVRACLCVGVCVCLGNGPKITGQGMQAKCILNSCLVYLSSF